jgi:hypothetical protein
MKGGVAGNPIAAAALDEQQARRLVLAPLLLVDERSHRAGRRRA